MNANTINNDVTIAGSVSVLASRYRIIRQLGQGGMGSVWLAEDMQLDNKLFAIKMLPSILVSNKRAYKQLKDEALVSMRLTHPNIVTLRAFEENNGNPFLVMDYIDGETLDDWLGDRGQELGASEEDVIRLLKPIAEALDYAHTEGVVHRDVKPANVMIRKDGRPFIMDFGIAREIQETMTRVTGKMSSGTLMYMSPEQLNGDVPKPSQDVYSFSAMVYECLKGEPPFCRGAIVDQIKNKEPDPLPEGVGIAASVMRGLAKQPENRPENCQKVFAEKGFLFKTANHDKKPGAGAKRIDSGALSEDVSHERSRIGWFLAFLFFMVFVGILWWNGNRNSFEPGEGPVSPPVTNIVDNPPPRLPTPPIEADAKEIAVEAAVQKEKIKGVDEADGFGLKKNDLSEAEKAKAEAEEKARKAEEARIAADLEEIALAQYRLLENEYKIELQKTQKNLQELQCAKPADAKHMLSAAQQQEIKRFREKQDDILKRMKEIRQQLEGVNFLQYVVKPGDSLGKIAYDHGITIKELKELNNIVDNSIRIGQILRVPIQSKCDGTSKLQSISNKKIESAAREDARPPVSQSASKVQLWEGGPYWADRNIGAEKPEDYGYYFWWGDTVGYKREGDKWVASDGSNSNFEFRKSNTPTYGKSVSDLRSEGWTTADGVLSPQHDAAQKHWGGDWRMPTDKEFNELERKCDWTWTTKNGVNGYIVRGKGNYSTKSIFLPCAGYGDGASLYLAWITGSLGLYWSSVPYSDNYYSWDLDFGSGNRGPSSYLRYLGQSVRPLQGFTK